MPMLPRLIVETLRALEDALLEFAGCVAVISQNSTANSTGDGAQLKLPDDINRTGVVPKEWGSVPVLLCL
jgi:hypothetical protein